MYTLPWKPAAWSLPPHTLQPPAATAAARAALSEILIGFRAAPAERPRAAGAARCAMCCCWYLV